MLWIVIINDRKTVERGLNKNSPELLIFIGVLKWWCNPFLLRNPAAHTHLSSGFPEKHEQLRSLTSIKCPLMGNPKLWGKEKEECFRTYSERNGQFCSFLYFWLYTMTLKLFYGNSEAKQKWLQKSTHFGKTLDIFFSKKKLVI